ncbi:hypothetical protein ACRB8A_03860 [Arthrobacter sp. G.S.26]|uniref:hypothetical protein n=1 Tax=Arthrobacter sp. G.S.26 TaxID=3433706 RepID=UPI003D7818D7
MTDDHEQLVQQVRFGLETIGELNAHHDFERLCLGLARRRIVSNILPATGPVSSGGDQGRDGESHWTNLPAELPGTSVFVALASTERVVLACTTQKKAVAGKIQKDIAKICGTGSTVKRVIYFTVTPIPVARRHQLQKKAKKDYKVSLDIWDAAAISEHLADEDLFYLAVSHLKVPASLAPAPSAPTPELPSWYIDSRDRWRSDRPNQASLGELMDLRALLRYATFNAEARSDLPELIAHARHLMDSAEDTGMALRCRYEAVVATYRGLQDMASVSDLARQFLDPVTKGAEDPGLLEDAFVMLQYMYGHWLRNGKSFSKEELDSYFDRLAEQVDERLAAAESVRLGMTLRSLSARMALSPASPDDLHTADYEVVTLDWDGTVDTEHHNLRTQHAPVPLRDLEKGMQLLLDVGRDIPAAPLYPVAPLAEFFETVSPYLAEHRLYMDVREALDTAVEAAEGKSARGRRAWERANRMLESNQLRAALNEVQEAKLNWWKGDTVEYSVEMSMLISDLYSRMGLPLAAKQYALSAATLAHSTSDPALAAFIPLAFMQASLCDYRSGMWLSSAGLAKAALDVHSSLSKAPGDPDRHPYLSELVESQLRIYGVARSSFPACFSIAKPVVLSLFGGEWVEQLEKTAKVMPNDVEYEPGFIFADAGSDRAYRWKAFGREWEVSCANDRISVLAAERFVAMLQIVLCEMTTYDPFFPPGRSEVKVMADVPKGAKLGTELPAGDHDQDGILQVNLTPVQHLDARTAHVEVSAAVLKTVYAASLRNGVQLRAWFEKAFDQGLWHKLLSSRPYDETADLLPDSAYEAMSRAEEDKPEGPVFPQAPELPAFEGYAEGFTAGRHAEINASRYRKLIPATRHTVAGLNGDDNFRATATRLRSEGWHDWHLLMAIANIAGNERLTREGFFEGDWRKNLSGPTAMDMMTRPELQDIASPELFTETELRDGLTFSLTATLNVYELECHTNPIDFTSIFQFLGDRFGYWTDDIEHEDIFLWGSHGSGS